MEIYEVRQDDEDADQDKVIGRFIDFDNAARFAAERGGITVEEVIEDFHLAVGKPALDLTSEELDAMIVRRVFICAVTIDDQPRTWSDDDDLDLVVDVRKGLAEVREFLRLFEARLAEAAYIAADGYYGCAAETLNATAELVGMLAADERVSIREGIREDAA